MSESAVVGLHRHATEAATGDIPKVAEFVADLVEFSDLLLTLLDVVVANPTAETSPIVAAMNGRWTIPTTGRIRGITQGSANGGGG